MSETNYFNIAPKFLALTPGTTVSVDPRLAVNWKWTPAQASTLNAADPGQPGQEMVIEVVTSGTTNYALTLGTNFSSAAVFNTGNTSGARIVLRFVSDGISWTPMLPNSGAAGQMITKMVIFTENATNTIHTGTVAIPAGAILHNIQVNNSVLWGAASAAMDVGDTADPNGYFAAIDLKATDLLVGEVLDTSPSTSWGGKEGAYLVAATGRRGPTSSNFGKYYAAGSNILGVITVGTPGSTAGRTQMVVTYSLGETIAAVATGP